MKDGSDFHLGEEVYVFIQEHKIYGNVRTISEDNLGIEFDWPESGYLLTLQCKPKIVTHA